jgi:hypothetical protein
MKNNDTDLIWEAYDSPGDSRPTEEQLARLEPDALLKFITGALPKFLQTQFNPQDYDEVKSKLFSAAALLNDPYGPGGMEHDAAQAEEPGEEVDYSWQDQPGVYPPGYN